VPVDPLEPMFGHFVLVDGVVVAGVFVAEGVAVVAATVVAPLAAEAFPAA
jgi:hypothetical protein